MSKPASTTPSSSRRAAVRASSAGGALASGGGVPAPATPPAARGALVCAAVIVAAGCVDTVSLGSGIDEGEGDGAGIPILPWVPPRGPGWQDIDGDVHDCVPALDTDLDGDGFTPRQGDCDDCDPDTGPDAVEMPTDPGTAKKDENCDGDDDEPAPTCDADLAVNAASPYAAVRALDLCTDAQRDGRGHDRWGVERAAWVLPDGSPEPTQGAYSLGHGILDRFGPNVSVRYGSRMLALSSGAARLPADADFEAPRGFDKGFACAPPEGFPQPAPACPTVQSGDPRDGVALEITLRAPPNAEALAFDFNFYTFELPGHFCSPYNDLFVALLDPPPTNGDGNIAFDPAGNIVSVNTVFLEACQCEGGPPCSIGGRLHACTLGAAPLVGTGFGSDMSHEGDRGATGWVTSTAEVARGGALTLRLSVHDAGDGFADSTVLLDHFRWLRREPVAPRSHRGD